MTRYFRYLITAGVMAIAFEASAGTAQAEIFGTIAPPQVPTGLQPPAGNTAFLNGHAVGTQSYICLPSGSGFSWTVIGSRPEATLFLTLKWFNGDIRQQIMTHFLGPNPSEGGLPRATWQSSFDTSAVWARAIANSTDPNFVVSGAIPWLLLEVVGTQRGPTGGDRLTPTTFIQRINTSGGVAPSLGCSQASNVGALEFVPYTADYFFYKSSRGK